MNNGEKNMEEDEKTKHPLTGKYVITKHCKQTYNYRSRGLLFEISGDRRAIVWTSGTSNIYNEHNEMAVQLYRDEDTGKITQTNDIHKVIQGIESEEVFWNAYGVEKCPERLYNGKFGSKGVKVVKFLNVVSLNENYDSKYMKYINKCFLDCLSIYKNTVENKYLWDMKEIKWPTYNPVIKTTIEENEKVIA